MSEWHPLPGDAGRAVHQRSSTGRASVILRVTTLGLATAGSWIHATVEEYVPQNAILRVNGDVATRENFADVFAALYSSNVQFTALVDVNAQSVCNEGGSNFAAAKANFTAAAPATISACFDLSGNVSTIVKFSVETS